MTEISMQQAVGAVRQAVAALSNRMAGEYGDLVPAASTERTALLVRGLEQLAGTPGAAAGGQTGAIGAADHETLDSWIRVADSFGLHDDAAEAGVRRAAGQQLRAVRDLVAPHVGTLTADSRES